MNIAKEWALAMSLAFLLVGGKTMADEQVLQARIHELEKEIKRLSTQMKTEKYGLRWVECPEAFEVESENKIPILAEVPEKAIKNNDGKPTHILIEGDNYHALTCLNFTHRGKIDVIYIDPPYNTGSDGFTYKDKRFLEKYPDGEKIGKNHPLRHSAWLSFMSKRLKLAKDLLSDRGVIFISIDDNEMANLKLLCDQIFGEDNFVGSFFWKRTETPPALSNTIRKKLEYILCYVRANIKGRKFTQGMTDGDDAPLLNTRNPLGQLRFPKGTVRFNMPDGEYTNKSGMKIKLLDKVLVKDGVNENTFRAEGHFKWGQQNLEEEVAGGTYFLIKSAKFSPRYQRASAAIKKPSNIVDSEVGVGTNEDAQKELSELGIDFSYAKPSSLVAYLAQMPFADRTNITVLDFFAGSGTTGHAVMKLNAQDGGSRQCILVQQREGEANICEKVTYERNRRVIEGYKNAKGEDVAGLGGSLKYYKTSFVGKHRSGEALDEDRSALAAKAGALLALAEDTLDEVKLSAKQTKYWQYFSDGAHRHTMIYFSDDLSAFESLVKKTDQIRAMDKAAKIAVYVFAIGSVEGFENEFDDMRRITLKPIPEPILAIYKAINGD